MLANELINRLERLGLLDQEIIEALREQLEQGGTRVTPEAVAKLLVDNGQLTQFQATKLIGELRSGQYESEASEDVDDLTAGLEEPDAVMDAEAFDAEPVEAEPVEAEPVEAEPIEAEPVEAVAAEPVGAESVGTTAEATAGGQSGSSRAAARRKSRTPEPSQWDSFKVYGRAGIVVALILVSAGIWFVLSREDAEKVIGRANELYNDQNYQEAQNAYLNFLEDFGAEHQFSSVARTRITMTELYKAAAFKQEPEVAVELAKEKLPAVAEEEGMNDERGNLAALLVDIAQNIADAASRATETVRKKELLGVLEEQMKLLENPLYMKATMKTTLAGQIQNVEEDRARVQREIDRNERLDAAELAMQQALEEKKTKEAYDVRKALLRDFPELHDNQRLVALIRNASGIQETLVKPSTNLPKVVTETSENEALRTIVLTNLEGNTVPDLRGETIYFRAGGSVLAFDGETGKLRWRQFVGYSKELPPLKLDDGVLLSESASLEILRCDADTGDVAWRSMIDETFSQPIPEDDDLYVSTDSGRLISIDAVSGDAKWATQFPQALETGPGVDGNANRAYITGNHSNLYMLNTRDGSCLESFYIGHEEGTVDVPPVPLLGHLFVIENAGPDFAKVHVLRTDEPEASPDAEGDNPSANKRLRIAQPAFRLVGNVRVPPIIQDRRVIVLTDRGEVMVYDIEPTAENDKVSEVAHLPAFYDQPTATQMAVGRSQMWITGTRLGRYELQINTGRVVRDWSIHELDTFIGKPIATDEALVHARILRETSAIRVTAANPKTGDVIWRTDVGVPISVITPIPDGPEMHVITSQAALFGLDRDSLSSGSTEGPIENPGDKSVAIRFKEPVYIDDQRFVLINEVDGETTMVYEPQRSSQKLRKVTLNLPSGRPTGALAAGGGLFLPLDSGRAVLMQWRNGSMLGAPFQPSSDPTEKVKWTDPIALPDDPDQIVIADSRKKIYRLRVGEQIRELSSKDLPYVLMGPAAGINSTMVASTAGPAGDSLVGFELATLEESFNTLLDQRIVWGPVAAGELALVKTDDSMLRGYRADGTEVFKVEIPPGHPVGRPVMKDSDVILVGETGWIVTLDTTNGQLKGQTNLGQPISATPLVTGDRLLVPGSEGVVYIADIPGNEQSNEE